MSRIQELLDRKRKEIALQKTRISDLSVLADRRTLNWDHNRFRIIAELKRASLSAGSIRTNLLPAELASAYEQSGASALSVLTEEHFFHGSLQDLKEVHDAVKLPLLQKNFILDRFQIAQAKNAGASFVLLIARFMTKQTLTELLNYSEEIGLNPIVEITNREDLDKLEHPVRYLGVNSRDLETLEVDTSKFEKLRPFLPDAYLIAESGIRDIDTLQTVIRSGYHAALIGEHFLRCENPADELARFVDASRGGTQTRPPSTLPKVKICGITSERDAMMAIDAGASALGFIFAESPRRISTEVFGSFRDRIPKSVLCVGVFRGQTETQVSDAIRQFNLDVAQIYDPHGHKDQIGIPFWKARIIKSIEDLVSHNDEGSILLDFKADEPELSFLWKEAGRRKIFALAGGLHSGNVAQAVAICKPEWIDVARGVEKNPGIKDENKVRAFIKEIR